MLTLSQNPSSPSWSFTTHDKARRTSNPFYASVELRVCASTHRDVNGSRGPEDAGAWRCTHGDETSRSESPLASRQVHSSLRNHNVAVNNLIDGLSSTYVKELWSFDSWLIRLDLWPGRCAVATIERSRPSRSPINGKACMDLQMAEIQECHQKKRDA